MKITVLLLLIALIATTAVKANVDEDFDVDAPETGVDRELWGYEWWRTNKAWKKKSSSSSDSDSDSDSSSSDSSRCKKRKERCCDCVDDCKSSHSGGSNRKSCFSDDCKNKCKRATEKCSGPNNWKKFHRKKC